MSCYIRHLTRLLDDAGLENTKENRKVLDSIIRTNLNLKGSKCSEVWREVKKTINEDWEKAIVNELRQK